MKEIAQNVFVGDELDARELFDGRDFKPSGKGWAIVHCCKEPYHRSALGYTGRAAPQDHPEYLVAKRQRRLILNMVDAKETRFFSLPLFEAALDFIETERQKHKVLVHCNQGASRAPSIGLLHLARVAAENEDPNFPARFEDAVEHFGSIYPGYEPGDGIRAFLKQNWLNLVPGFREG